MVNSQGEAKFTVFSWVLECSNPFEWQYLELILDGMEVKLEKKGCHFVIVFVFMTYFCVEHVPCNKCLGKEDYIVLIACQIKGCYWKQMVGLIHEWTFNSIVLKGHAFTQWWFCSQVFWEDIMNEIKRNVFLFIIHLFLTFPCMIDYLRVRSLLLISCRTT